MRIAHFGNSWELGHKDPASPFLRQHLPRRVAAWLQLQQMRSEKMQFKMLQMQDLADVWRRPAFLHLLKNYSGALAMQSASGGSGFVRLLEAIEALMAKFEANQ